MTASATTAALPPAPPNVAGPAIAMRRMGNPLLHNLPQTPGAASKSEAADFQSLVARLTGQDSRASSGKATQAAAPPGQASASHVPASQVPSIQVGGTPAAATPSPSRPVALTAAPKKAAAQSAPAQVVVGQVVVGQVAAAASAAALQPGAAPPPLPAAPVPAQARSDQAPAQAGKATEAKGKPAKTATRTSAHLKQATSQGAAALALGIMPPTAPVMPAPPAGTGAGTGNQAQDGDNDTTGTAPAGVHGVTDQPAGALQDTPTALPAQAYAADAARTAKLDTDSFPNMPDDAADKENFDSVNGAMAAPAAVAQAATAQPVTQPAAAAPASAAANLSHTPPTAQVAHAVAAVHVAPGASGQVTIHLHPDDLGAVQVRIERAHDGTATITVQVEKTETLHSMQQDLSHLHQALDRAGVPQEQRQLTLQLGTPAPPASFGANAHQGGGQNRGGQPQPQHRGGAAAMTTQEIQDEPATIRWRAAGINITA